MSEPAFTTAQREVLDRGLAEARGREAEAGRARGGLGPADKQ
jgi:hypothetical protein